MKMVGPNGSYTSQTNYVTPPLPDPSNWTLSDLTSLASVLR